MMSLARKMTSLEPQSDVFRKVKGHPYTQKMTSLDPQYDMFDLQNDGFIPAKCRL